MTGLAAAWREAAATGLRWLVVTGDDGTALTAELAASMLTGAGLSAVAADGATLPAVVRHEPPHDVVVAVLTPAELREIEDLAPLAIAVLDVGDAAALDVALRSGSVVGVAHEAGSAAVAAEAERQGVSHVTVRLEVPAAGELGVVPDTGAATILLVDRAFGPDPEHHAELLVDLAAVTWPVTPERVVAALVAAALARSVGVTAEAVGAALAPPGEAPG